MCLLQNGFGYFVDLLKARLELLDPEAVMNKNSVARIVVLILIAATPASGALITIDFEGLADSTNVGSFYSGQGATFTGALVLSSGISLDEAEFPPRSGVNVAFDATGPIRIDFGSLVGSFSAYFTYAIQLRLAAFNNANLQVGSATSLFSSNFVSSGNAPNELMQIVFSTGIDHVLISGNLAGGSFVMDDAKFNTSIGTVASPEPAPAALFLIGLLGVTAMSRRRLRR